MEEIKDKIINLSRMFYDLVSNTQCNNFQNYVGHDDTSSQSLFQKYYVYNICAKGLS